MEKLSEVRLRYYHVVTPYFSLSFLLNRTRFSQHHMHRYSAKPAMIIFESRGLRGRLWTYDVFQARDRNAHWSRSSAAPEKRAEAAAGSAEFLSGFSQPVRLNQPARLTAQPWAYKNLDVILDWYVWFLYDLLLINYFFIFGCICSSRLSCSFSF